MNRYQGLWNNTIRQWLFNVASKYTPLVCWIFQAENNKNWSRNSIKSRRVGNNIKTAENNIKSAENNIKSAENNIKSAENIIKKCQSKYKSAEYNYAGCFKPKITQKAANNIKRNHNITEQHS